MRDFRDREFIWVKWQKPWIALLCSAENNWNRQKPSMQLRSKILKINTLKTLCLSVFWKPTLQRRSWFNQNSFCFICTFYLIKKNIKNSAESAVGDQENSIGLHWDYSSSANFLPPRAGKMSLLEKDQNRLKSDNHFQSISLRARFWCTIGLLTGFWL